MRPAERDVGPSTRSLLLDASLIAIAHAILCVIVRSRGFDHVSDDDFARVTIAQAFASAPKLDPSGTSWLPLPFWMLGLAMTLLGRTLEIARGASILFASLAAAAPYVALRTTGSTRPRALTALAFALVSPWSLWLGASTVPESMTASLAAAGAIAIGADRRTTASTWFAVAIAAACLSRYEAWPVAAVLAIALAARLVRSFERQYAGGATWLLGLVVVAPLAWMAWNAGAHGSPLHFFHRVSNFKRAIGEGSTDVASALAFYPKLLVQFRPDVLAATLGALVVFAMRPETRARWTVPLLAVAAQIAFLAVGERAGGAPTHHAERALLGASFVLAMFAADTLIERAAETAAEPTARLLFSTVAAVVVTTAWASSSATAKVVPGTSAADDRSAQMREGARLRDARAAHLVVTPCAYEHFALIAEFGAPERVEVRAQAPAGPPCPKVDQVDER